MDYEKEIELLKRKRAEVFDLDYRLVVFLVGFIVTTILQPMLSMIFGYLASFLNSRKVRKVVEIPCPRCKEPFGKMSRFMVSIGPNVCQNCNLKLDSEPENYFSKTMLMVLAILVGSMGMFQAYLWNIGKMNDYGLFLGCVFIVGAIALAVYTHMNKRTQI